MEEIGADWVGTPRLEIMSDNFYQGGTGRATDGTDISTRAKHREYMKIHGLAVASDFKETRERARQKRAEFYSGTSYEHGKAIGRAVDKAWHNVFGDGRKR